MSDKLDAIKNLSYESLRIKITNRIILVVSSVLLITSLVPVSITLFFYYIMGGRDINLFGAIICVVLITSAVIALFLIIPNLRPLLKERRKRKKDTAF